MNILLINTNPVVSRLVSLCMRDESIVFEEVEHVTEVEGSAYDIVFVDDASYNDKVVAFSSWVAKIGKLVFLSSRDAGEEIGGKFDMVIKKPFLPSQIQDIIDSVKAEMEETKATEEETPLSMTEIEVSSEMTVDDTSIEDAEEEKENETSFIFPLSSSSETTETDHCETEELAEDEAVSTPKVLDSNEIEQIKALLEEDDEVLPEVNLEDEEEIEARKVEVITQKLEEDGLEIVDEEKIIDELSQKSTKSSKQKKRLKKKKKKKEEVYTFEEALLAAVENMKPKKIKKLLKGAEVTIKIRFKDDV